MFLFMFLTTVSAMDDKHSSNSFNQNASLQIFEGSCQAIIDQLHENNNKITLQTEKMQQNLQKMKEKRKKDKDQISQLKQELEQTKDLRTQRDNAITKINDMQQYLDKTLSEKDTLRGEYDTLQKLNMQLEIEFKLKNAQLENTQEQLEQWKQEYERLRNQYKEFQQETAEQAQERIDKLENERNALQNRNTQYLVEAVKNSRERLDDVHEQIIDNYKEAIDNLQDDANDLRNRHEECLYNQSYEYGIHDGIAMERSAQPGRAGRLYPGQLGQIVPSTPVPVGIPVKSYVGNTITPQSKHNDSMIQSKTFEEESKQSDDDSNE